jgi:hypothetical protein
MKSLISICLWLMALGANAQNSDAGNNRPDSTKKIESVELSCGQCQFHLKGKGCDLAVRIEGKAYFIDGAHIDGFGDAHAADGFCKAVRKAAAQGEIVNGRFKATYLKLLPVAK